MRTFVAGVRGVSGLWTIYGISLIWYRYKHSKTQFSILDALSFRQSDIMYVLDATHISFLSEPNCLLRLKPFGSLKKYKDGPALPFLQPEHTHHHSFARF